MTSPYYIIILLNPKMFSWKYEAFKNASAGNCCIPVKVQMPEKSGVPLGFQSEINQVVRSVP